MKHQRLRWIFFVAVLAGFGLTNCVSEQEPLPVDCAVSGPNVPTVSTADANCGQDDGRAEVTVTGGTGTITFTLSGGASNTTGIFTGLAAGSYTVNVTDQSDCSQELNFQIQNADGVNITAATTDTSCGQSTGTISVTPTGGVQPYSFSLDGGTFQSSTQFVNLAQGEYEVTARDASGCEVTIQATVESGVLFAQIKSIVETNCAVSGCHDGSISPDFRNDNNIVSRAERIGIRTGQRSMPPPSSGRTLSNSQIQTIACWVADGASSN